MPQPFVRFAGFVGLQARFHSQLLQLYCSLDFEANQLSRLVHHVILELALLVAVQRLTEEGNPAVGIFRSRQVGLRNGKPDPCCFLIMNVVRLRNA